MMNLLSIAVIISLVVIGISYIAVVGFFIYYHNQLFNYMLYDRESKEGIVFGDNYIEELPDSINIDDLV